MYYLLRKETELNFKKIKGVQKFTIHPAAGAADIEWDPYTRLTYDPFRYAAAAVGFNIIDMRIRVKGTIRSNQQDIYLISNLDGTEFRLIGPIYTEPGRYTPKYNLATHPLSPKARDVLLEMEKREKNVTIAGPLLLPSYYYNPLTLITEQIKVDKENDQE